MNSFSFTKVSRMQLGNPCNMNFHFFSINWIKQKHPTEAILRLGSHDIMNPRDYDAHHLCPHLRIQFLLT